jgi:hypothetical protein
MEQWRKLYTALKSGLPVHRNFLEFLIIIISPIYFHLNYWEKRECNSSAEEIEIAKPVEVPIYLETKNIHFCQDILILSRNPVPSSCFATKYQYWINVFGYLLSWVICSCRSLYSPNDAFERQGAYEGPGCTTVKILNEVRNLVHKLFLFGKVHYSTSPFILTVRVSNPGIVLTQAGAPSSSYTELYYVSLQRFVCL